MKTWDIQKTQFKVADFVNWAKNGELNLSPSFQRRAVWPKGAKSYLLDSVLRGLPIPPIILRDLPPDIQTFRSVREVVDGQQRLRTLLTYIAPHVVNDFSMDRDDFAISRTHNPKLAGMRFRDLPQEHQRRVLDYQFMVHIFPSETDDRDILEIFARMNATGTKLNNQELRNAEYFGEFKSKAFSLAAEHLHLWREWKLFTESQIARMAEVEFTSELLILVISGISDNKKSVIDDAYKRLDETFPNQQETTRRARWVIEAMNSAYLPSFPDILSTKALAYPLFASIYDLSYGLGSELCATKTKPIPSATLRKLGERAQRALDGEAPKEVLLSIEARSSQAKNRREITTYLTREA